MTKDEAMGVILSSPQYQELMEALEEAKKTLGSEERKEMTQSLLNSTEEFMQQQKATKPDGAAGKSFWA